MSFRTIIEPFKIKMVEPIYMTSREEREKYLEEAHYNPFLLKSEQAIIDFLTDSGTSAMSAEQWGGIMRGDEAYAGSASWLRMEKEVKHLTGFPHILPTHQGRAAERILYSHIGGPGRVFISNTHFDTTRANIEFSGARAIDIPVPEASDTKTYYPFKGNIDTVKLLELISSSTEEIAAVILTVTNNSGGGQPVSMQNALETSNICRQHNIPFFIDCARIAENAYFIQQREKEYANMSSHEIARMMFRLADGAIMSAKKDALVNMGGFLALKDGQLANECRNLLIITEGFNTYGGLSGRDMEAIAIGLREIFHPDYLNYRIKSTAYLGEHLDNMGVPIMLPVGGHAVYIDAKALYPHIPVDQYPGQALVCELYLHGGIRAVEIGSVMFGKYDESHKLIPHTLELVRLAIPRRVYTQSHIDYVIEVFEKVLENRDNVRGFKITEEPLFLRHFTAHFQPAESFAEAGK